MVFREPITPGGDPLFVSTNAGELASLVLPRREWELLNNAEELIVTIEAVETEPATETIDMVEPITGGLPRVPSL